MSTLRELHDSGKMQRGQATYFSDDETPANWTDYTPLTGSFAVTPLGVLYVYSDGAWVDQGGTGSGAPTTADYLVGTAQGGLSAEIVVGTAPGGELGGTWATPTVDSSHAGGTHAATQAAAEATAAAANTADIATHAGAADPHTVYQKESEKAAASGYASLGADSLVPQDQLGTGVQDGTKFLRDDGTWQAPTAAHPDLATHDTLGLATQSELDTHAGAADPHAGYLKESEVSGLAVPVVVLGTAAGAGIATTAVRTDGTIVAFDVTNPSTQAFGDAAAVGVVALAARRDHKHAMMADPVTAHVAAGDPHTGYVLEADTNWIDLTDTGETSLHTHPGGGGGLTSPQVLARTCGS